MKPVITREYLDSLPNETILIIRDYIWERFGTKPGATVKKNKGCRSTDDKEAA